MNEVQIDSFIKDLQIILYDLNIFCRATADVFKSEYRWNDNDARVFLFNSIGQSCFLENFTLSFVYNEILQNANDWRKTQKYFPSNDNSDYEKIAAQYVCHIRDNFFLNFLINIEHCLRIFGVNCEPQIIHEKIGNVKNRIIDYLEFDPESKKLFEILFTLRNTIHNGGLHSKSKQSIIYKDKTFEFIEKQDTKTSLDNINFLFTEALIFFKSTFIHDKSKSIEIIEHPYKSFFN